MSSWLAFAPVAAFLIACALGLRVLVRGVGRRRRASGGAPTPAAPWGIAVLRSPWTGAFWLLFGLIGLALWRPAAGWQAEGSAYWTDGRLPALDESVRGAIVDWAREQRPVGVAVGLVTPDGTARATFGSARLPGGVPLRDATFEIGSITKTLTGILLASLVDRGMVSLDDRLADLLPAGEELPAELRSITLAHLATHTAGLPRTPPGMGGPGMLLRLLLGLNPYAGYTTDQLLLALEDTDLQSAPGERSEYSNFGFGLLGWILGREAAMGYANALREFVYGPLGLPGIELGPSGDTGSRLATGYRVRQVAGPVRLGLAAEPWDLPEAFEGAGAVRSTLEGMVGYLAANMGQGAHAERGTHGVDAAIRLAQQEHFHVSPNRGIGLAWVRDRRRDVGQTVIWHNGSTGGFRSFLGFTEDRRFGVVVLANALASVDPLGARLLRAISGGNRVRWSTIGGRGSAP